MALTIRGISSAVSTSPADSKNEHKTPSGLDMEPNVLAIALCCSGNQVAASFVGAKSRKGWAKAAIPCPVMTIANRLESGTAGKVLRYLIIRPSRFTQPPNIICEENKNMSHEMLVKYHQNMANFNTIIANFNPTWSISY